MKTILVFTQINYAFDSNKTKLLSFFSKRKNCHLGRDGSSGDKIQIFSLEVST